MTVNVNEIKLAQSIAAEAEKNGGRAYYVGGCVRDRLLKIDNYDIDIEIHGITPEKLKEILSKFGTPIQYGSSFGIFSLKEVHIDIALPRKEKKVGNKHTDFVVDIDAFVGTKKAAMRRDFTVNALMRDVLTDDIVDHFGGLDDLKNKVLRHVNDDSFGEDALRVLRAAQFASRFGFEIHPDTKRLCGEMDITSLSRERIFEEMKKALIKSPKPSIFFEVLRSFKQLSYWFPELESLIGIEQNPVYHAEGDVWNHTMMTLDKAANYRDKVQHPFWFMLCALAHDFGKAVCYSVGDGVIHAYGHEYESEKIAATFLQRLTNNNQLIKYVLNITKLHMRPNIAARNNSAAKVTNKIFDSCLYPMDLIYFCQADDKGRIMKVNQPDTLEYLLKHYEIYKSIMSKPYVKGSDLVEYGIAPGEHFSKLLAYAHKLRLSGVPKESALKQTLTYAGTLK